MSSSGPEKPPSLPPPPGWLERLRRSLRRQSRSLYRSIRHPRQRRKGALRDWLGARIHNRDLWQFRRAPVANGMAGGLFISMLPIPLQSLFAAAVGIARGWNLPSAIVATWVSNPFTYLPMFIAAKASVMWLYGLFDAEPAIRKLTFSHVRDLDPSEWWDLASTAGPELLLGYVIVGIGCAIAGYLIVHSFWWLVRHHEEPDRPLRHRGASGKAMPSCRLSAKKARGAAEPGTVPPPSGPPDSPPPPPAILPPRRGLRNQENGT